MSSRTRMAPSFGKVTERGCRSPHSNVDQAAPGVWNYQQAASMLLDGVPADELAGFLATLDRIIDRLRTAEGTADQPR